MRNLVLFLGKLYFYGGVKYVKYANFAWQSSFELKSKSHHNIPATHFSSKGSVHQLKGVSWLRLLAFSALVVGVDFGGLKTDENFPHQTKHWLTEFISLNESFEPVYAKSQIKVPAKEKETLAHSNSISFQPPSSIISKTERMENASFALNNRTQGEELLHLDTKSTAQIPTGHLAERIDFKPQKKTLEFTQPISVTKNDFIFDYLPNYLVNERSTNKKWNIFLAVGPQLVNGDVTQPSAETYEELTGINNIESESDGVIYSHSQSSFSAHVGVGYDLSKRWSMNVAIQYTQFDGSQLAFYNSEVRRFQTILTTVAVSDENGSKAFETEEETIEFTNHFSDTLTANYRLSNLEIPVSVHYKHTWGKYYGFLRTGFSGVIRSRYTSSYYSNEIEPGIITQENWKLSAMNVHLGMGLGYNIQPDFSVQIYPQFTKLMPLEELYSSKQATRSLGLFAGITYAFR